ncbi:hypothetical protein BDZ89DRAFT_1129283 [Hymenopellis radicata]|nr:hypothetical protein BDZ89DRAFT_1129283 [Hymenopellis radicata]
MPTYKYHFIKNIPYDLVEADSPVYLITRDSKSCGLPHCGCSQTWPDAFSNPSSLDNFRRHMLKHQEGQLRVTSQTTDAVKEACMTQYQRPLGSHVHICPDVDRSAESILRHRVNYAAALHTMRQDAEHEYTAQTAEPDQKWLFADRVSAFLNAPWPNQKVQSALDDHKFALSGVGRQYARAVSYLPFIVWTYLVNPQGVVFDVATDYKASRPPGTPTTLAAWRTAVENLSETNPIYYRILEGTSLKG